MVRPIIAGSVDALWAAEDAARRFDDPEGVHAMRVATRRLRAALDMARPLFPKRWFRAFRRTVRDLAGALGDVRDADVLLAILVHYGASSTGTEQAGVSRLIERVTQDRADARARLVVLLDDLDRRKVRKDALARFQRKGRRVEPRKRDARRLIAGSAQRFLERATLPDPGDVEALHDLRIATKRLRYALQLFEGALGTRGASIAGDLATLQEHLGEIHNLDVLLDLTRGELLALADAPDQGNTRQEQAAGLLDLARRISHDRRERYAALSHHWSALPATSLREAIGAMARIDAPTIPAPQDSPSRPASLVAASLAGVTLEPDGAAWAIAEWTDEGGGFDPPMLIAPPHVHHEDDESWYVLEGTLAFRLDGEVSEAPAGSAVTVPRGVVHTWWNPSSAPARYLIVMTPRIRELIETIHAHTSSREDLEAHFRQHRSELVETAI